MYRIGRMDWNGATATRQNRVHGQDTTEKSVEWLSWQRRAHGREARSFGYVAEKSVKTQPRLTTDFGLQRGATQIVSDDNIMWTKVVRIIEINNFVFWIISIRGHMQSVEPKYSVFGRAGKGAGQVRPTIDMLCPRASSIWKGWKTNRIASDWIWGVQMKSNGKTHKMKVLPFFETNNFVFYEIFIRGRLVPQTRPARYSQFQTKLFCKVRVKPSELDPN